MTVRLTALCAGMGIARPLLALAGSDEISRTNEAIHQEATIRASRQRVYAGLTDPAQFTKLTTFADIKDAPPAQIAHEVGAYER
jgi:hypothetical protein